ncbi:MAG: YqgE/AlgH family protein, partial [Mariprofundus sp.]
MQINHLAGQILLADPALNDPNFKDAVVLVCHHDAEGCMGLIINRPRQIDVFDVLKDIGICIPDTACKAETRLARVFEGGPMDDFRGFVLHDGWHVYESTIQISPELHLTASRDVLEDLGG